MTLEETPHAVLLSLTTIVGLCIGSFLNVVIYRISLTVTSDDPLIKSNLILPRSYCPFCKSPIQAKDNIPLISFLLLKGRCRHCHRRISYVYPLVELTASIITSAVAAHYDYSFQAIPALIFCWLLIPLVVIDLQEQLLPDILTYALLWVGLLASVWGFVSSSESAIVGAALGYTILWLINRLYLSLRGIDGIGHGDFKFLAGIGAWLGWERIPQTIMLASILGGVVGVLMLLSGASRKNSIPFGPFLGISALITLFLPFT